MEFWIDIEDAAGNKLGAGPITTATEWQSTPRLDEAGTFAFEMPASDPKAALLANKRVARCWGIVDGAVREIGAGIVDDIEVVSGTPTMLRVSGPDLLAELGGRTIRSLVICEQALVYLTFDADMGAWKGSVRHLENDAGAIVDEDLPTSHDGVIDAGGELVDLWATTDDQKSYVYVGYDARFDFVRVWLGDYLETNRAKSTLLAQYFDGSGWADLPDLVDGTRGQNMYGEWCTFSQSGDITWTRPADWARVAPTVASGSWFWVRFTVQLGEATDPIRIREAAVWGDVPTQGGVDQIMAFAPATWVRSGYPATAAPKYLEVHGESVLAALRLLSEQGGQAGGAPVREHFRLGSGRAIEWFGAWTPTGLRAVGEATAAAEGAGELCLIRNLEVRQSSAEVVTRLYPESADGITLALTTRTAPAGFALSKAGEYVEHSAGIAAFGVVEASRRFSDISSQQPDSFYVHPSMTANALCDRAVEWLRTRAVRQDYYAVEVLGVAGALRPGETIDVVYHEWRDGVHTVAIDTVADGAPLCILAATARIDEDGLHTVALELATVDRQAADDAGVLTGAIQDSRRMGGVTGNVVTQRVVATPISGNVAITGGTVDGVTIGANVPGAGVFTGLNVLGSIAVGGLVDGVDVAGFWSAYGAHAADPAAHHAPVTVGNTGLSLSGQQLSLNLAATSGLEIASGLRLADSIAGDGLTIANKVLAVGAGDGLTVSADAVALTTPGTLAHDSPNAAAGNHTHAITALASTMGGEEALLKSSAAGGLALASLQTSGAVDVGQGLTAGGSGFRVIHHTHDYDHVHVVVNPGTYWNLDEQFGVDIDDSLLVRGYIVGKHALQIADAAAIFHFDGPEPYETDFTGSPTGHMGQSPSYEGATIYRPGRFGKAAQFGEPTTNLVRNPSFETDLGYVTFSYDGTSPTRERSASAAYVGGYGLRWVFGASPNSARAQQLTGASPSLGDTYTFSVYVRAVGQSVGKGVFVSIIATGGATGEESSVASYRPGEDWQRLSVTHTVEQSDRTSIYVRVSLSSTESAEGDEIHLDGWQLEQQAGPTPYCDGSLGPGHAWSGTAHASTSTRSAGYLRYEGMEDAFLGDRGTVMAWVLLEQIDSRQGVVRIAGEGATYIILRIYPGGVVHGFWGSRTLSSSGIATLTVRAWHHLALVADGTDLILYLDGQEVVRDTISSPYTPVAGATLYVGADGASAYALDGLIDDLVIVKRGLDADEIRAVYESNAPVFAETSTWHWRAGRNLVWADAEGFWAVDQDGDPVFAISGVDSKSWGGATLGAGDVFIGNVGQGHYLHWDDSASKLTIRGDVAITGSVSVAWDEITNKPDGAGRLGTGASPGAAGLWLTGSRMGYYDGSAWPVWIDNQGRFAFGNSTGTQYVKWDGSTLSIAGNGSGITSINGGNIQTGTVTATQIASRTITAGKIVSGTITANEIASKTITADRLNVTTLSAISANLGSVTAGTVTGATIQTASSGNRVVMNNADLTVQQSGEAVYLTKWKNSSITGFADAWGFINLQKTNPLSQTTGVFNVGYSMDASNETILAMYRGGVDVTLNYAGSWHTAAHFTMNGVAINGGLGVNIAYTPGAGDINAGRYLRTDGDRVMFNDSNWLRRNGTHIEWWNGSTYVQLD